MKYLLILMPVFLFMTACNSTKEAAQAKQMEEEDSMFLMLKKGPCFGNCPVFTLSVYKSGLAELHGKSNLANRGKYKKQLTQEELDDLNLSCEDADLISMQDNYPSQIADLPLITIKYVTEDSTKVIRGKENRPVKLEALERKLSAIVHAEDWTLVEAPEGEIGGITPPEEQREELVKTEIIIQPAAGVLLPKWIQKNKERYGIRLLDRVSAKKNYWLITWDQAKGEPNEFLDKLHRDPEIQMAQFNMTVEPRK